MTEHAAHCAVCAKPRKAECSHVECPKRRRITAQVRDEPAPRTVDGDTEVFDVRAAPRRGAHG